MKILGQRGPEISRTKGFVTDADADADADKF